ncbi:hypothetical protein BRD02_04415 [Halobacteriales archaeon QS_8_69_73]|nr:MAG: hypothetical protein BRD02_04415 [Halobacteriales archaeon QS_8_69_73]
MGTPGALTLYLVDAPAPTLVDTGSANSPPRILEALEEVGVAPTAVEHVLVTHVHLDHGGGAGALAESLPNATFHVHERGTPYLTDPEKLSRLKRSVDRAMGLEDAYGDPELAPLRGPRPGDRRTVRHRRRRDVPGRRDAPDDAAAGLRPGGQPRDRPPAPGAGAIGDVLRPRRPRRGRRRGAGPLRGDAAGVGRDRRRLPRPTRRRRRRHRRGAGRAVDEPDRQPGRGGRAGVSRPDGRLSARSRLQLPSAASSGSRDSSGIRPIVAEESRKNCGRQYQSAAAPAATAGSACRLSRTASTVSPNARNDSPRTASWPSSPKARRASTSWATTMTAPAAAAAVVERAPSSRPHSATTDSAANSPKPTA